MQTMDGPLLQIPNADFAALMSAVVARGLPFRFQASGSSMAPFIHNHDVVIIEPLPERLHIGDVIAYTCPASSRLIVHRIVCLSQSGYTTRGDNTRQLDPPITRSHILGRVTHVERNNKPHSWGLGPHKTLIAALSRRGWLIPLINVLRPHFRLFKRISQ